ncbi:hypothetical protein [Reichenbachiella agariperforans]|uniref:hypothetical protein n=1 Tax=Reichenbachiella agariperforans TaxID=156994 RepID=UPI001C07F2B5|nr:hypothetical protein [Reichenbachiella agariperforans]MBU2914380.1 hypothetical protein [Reichenbachiella agariperforans]
MPVIQFQYSIWLLPLYLLIALAFTYLLYAKSGPWNQQTNRLLFALRFALWSVLSILLLNPMINQYLEQLESPRVVLAVDNSASIRNTMDSTQITLLHDQMSKLSEKLEGRGYEVIKMGLGRGFESWDDMTFVEPTTDLSEMMSSITASFENTNLASVFLMSDGKFNRGVSPLYQPYQFHLNTIGVGDTTQQLDLELDNILFNKIAYQGNRYPVVVEVKNYGFKGRKTKLSIRREGKVLETKEVNFDSGQGVTRVVFEVKATHDGLQPLDVVLAPLDEEVIQQNNSQRIYVDVIDGKQNILIAAPAPHPDLKALKAVIENNQNFEVTVYIAGVGDYPEEKYDLAIVHNVYDGANRTRSILAKLEKQKVPLFYIVGSQTNFRTLARENKVLQVVQKRNQRDRVIASLNPEMDLFTLDSELNERWQEFVPLSVPYGDINIPANAKVLLNQKIGSVTVNKPLLFTVAADDVKQAYLLADGIWQWRMQEYGLYEDTQSFDEFFLKLVQYLSTKNDKRKFKFYPTDTEYNTNEPVHFQAELYNDVYERIYGQEIKISVGEVGKETKEYSFVPASQYAKLELANLEPANYRYEASTLVDGKSEKVSGSFVVKEQQLEQLDQVADFGLLQQLAIQNQGQFYTLADWDEMLGDVESYDFKPRVHFQEEIFPLVNLIWVLFVLLVLVSSEWLLRKYSGGY